MDIFALLAAFGGGILGASIGALPAFIMTGVTCLIGAIAGEANVVGSVAFGSMFGPHIAFAGGVAAAAYARKAGKLENGADIATAGFGLGDPVVLLVGGIFGIVGFLIAYAVGLLFGPIIPATDTPGITVFISGIIARLAFGKRGLLSGGDRKVLSSGNALTTTLIVAVGYSLITGGIYAALTAAGVAADSPLMASYNVIMFGIAAVGLVFAEFGQAYFGCHHILIISAMAAMRGTSPAMSVILALVCGVIAALLCDFETNFINTDVDSHIDGPAFAICIMTFLINCIFPA